MVHIIIATVFGLAMAGLFLKLRRMLKKKSPHSHLVLFMGYMCMMVFVMFACAAVIGILENFYSVWIAWFAGLGVAIALMAVLFKLFFQKAQKI